MPPDGDSLPSAFGQLLKELREKAGMTQEGLAGEAGLERTYISFLERGHRQPTLRVLFALCAALNVSPADAVRQLEDRLPGTGKRR